MNAFAKRSADIASDSFLFRQLRYLRARLHRHSHFFVSA